MNRFSIHGDFMRVHIDFGAELANRLTIDADSAGGHQLFALSPRADAGMRQDFVQALFHEAHCKESTDNLER